MLNRSAVMVKPRQPFLDWLHAADPTGGSITLGELGQDPTIYLLPECETAGDVQRRNIRRAVGGVVDRGRGLASRPQLRCFPPLV